jgi:hypothetical protein
MRDFESKSRQDWEDLIGLSWIIYEE